MTREPRSSFVIIMASLALGAGLARAQAPDTSSPDAAGQGSAAGVSEIVYLNFSDGTENLTRGTADDAVANVSSIGAAVPYPAFAWPAIATGATTRGEVIRRVVRRVHELFLPYNILVTTVRPARGPYTMVLIGGSAEDIGVPQRLGGVAYLDCQDRQHANVVFAFPEALRGSEHALAVSIAQEAAHAFGLEHTSNRRDVMYPEIDPTQERFTDEESPILGDRLCGNVTQNSHQMMLQTVGAWPGDSKPLDDGTRADRTAPRLTLQAPLESGELPQPVTVVATAEDEAGIDRLVLTASAGADAPPGERHIRHRPPFTWSLTGFPAGPLTLTLTAYDASGNATVVAREIRVGAPPPAPAGCRMAAGTVPGAAPAPGSSLWWAGLGLWLAVVFRRAGRERARRACTGRAGPL